MRCGSPSTKRPSRTSPTPRACPPDRSAQTRLERGHAQPRRGVVSTHGVRTMSAPRYRDMGSSATDKKEMLAGGEIVFLIERFLLTPPTAPPKITRLWAGGHERKGSSPRRLVGFASAFVCSLFLAAPLVNELSSPWARISLDDQCSRIQRAHCLKEP